MPPLITPTTRSRNGCIDYRKVKVKYDEIRPPLVRDLYATQTRLSGIQVACSTTVSALVVVVPHRNCWGDQCRDGDKTSIRTIAGASRCSSDDRVYRPRIELYFARHSFELLIGPEFVNEMNANVVMMMHQDPLVVADTISAIGYSYEVSNDPGALLLVLD
ncbi:hypothetical protein LX36DRAFT_753150 [Colletotrichum falcatum]|nr:hypothetical protein LX36DRAFT_753150 [Colletotrichum falcatum]